MSFRNFSNKIINLITTSNNPKIFFFQIGCFPSSDETYNHEYPYVLEKYKKNFPNIEYYQILIDKMYKDNKCRLNEQNYNNIIIYPDFINDEEYNSIIELCHFINNFNCLSIIMEFTSIIREQYYKKNNMTEYLYIAPSCCLINTNHILFNPILRYENNKYLFFRPDREDQLSNYYNSPITDKEMDFVLGELKRRKEKLSFYRSVINIMRMDLKDGDLEIQKNYNKSYSHFFLIRKNILYRLGGYENHSSRVLIQDFEKSQHSNLETYMYDLVFKVLYDSLVFLFKDENLVQENYAKVLFNNDAEMNKCIEYFIN